MKRLILTTLMLVVSIAFCFAQTSSDEVIRCSSVEYNEGLLQKYPERGTVEDFEQWMKKKRATMSTENRMVTTYTIPVIFHVIHNGEAVGATRNVDQLYIDEQLRQLNEDFANLSGSTDPVAADTEIQFCAALVDESGNLLTEPGINRRHRNDFGFSAPSWTTGYVDGTIKPATQWDPDLYCNIWVLDVSGGVLGWAQFPDATGLPGLNAIGGPANEDGVVVLYSSVGSLTTPFGGGNAAYDNGRTLTHEIGHWAGLRHIWGDGGCGADDYCNDTPESDASNFGCPTGHVSCGTTDMVENYMDYTDDDCMNIFTLDQKARMHVVFDPANGVPRRASLNNSTVCTSDPIIAFTSVSTSVVEGTDCGFINYQIEVSVANPSTSDVSGIITVDGSSTATGGLDYLGGSGVVTFPAGSTSPQMLDISIAEDAIPEAVETVVLKISSTTGGALIGGNDTHTVGIADDDPVPGSVPVYTYESQDFNAGLNGWTIVDGGSTSDTWYVTANGGNNLDGSNFVFSDSDAPGNGSTTYEELLSPVMNTSSASTLNLEFDYYFRKYTSGYVEMALVEVFDGSSWVNVFTQTGSGADIGAWGAPVTETIDVSAYANANFQVKFIFDAQWDWWWAIDNVTVIGDFTLPIETTVNSSSGFMSANFGPMQTVHFLDENTGNIMLTLENLSSHDYGCTMVEIDRAGITSYASPAPESVDIIDKNFIVTPEFNNSSGSYNVTLYYTDAEITGFEGSNSLGSTKADLVMVKSEGAVSAASTLELTGTSPVMYGSGSDWQFTGTYSSGFSGIALGNQPVIPVRLISFEAFAEKNSIDLVWKTAMEINNKGFEIWRGTSEDNMQNIGFVEGSGNSQSELRYDFVDEDVEKGIRYYYRLKQVDFDGKFDWSEVRTAKILGELDFQFSPNPVTNTLNVSLGESQLTSIEIYNLSGQKVCTQQINSSTNNQIDLDVSELSRGAYLIVFKNASSILKHDRFIKI